MRGKRNKTEVKGQFSEKGRSQEESAGSCAVTGAASVFLSDLERG